MRREKFYPPACSFSENMLKILIGKVSIWTRDSKLLSKRSSLIKCDVKCTTTKSRGQLRYRSIKLTWKIDGQTISDIKINKKRLSNVLRNLKSFVVFESNLYSYLSDFYAKQAFLGIIVKKVNPDE